MPTRPTALSRGSSAKAISCRSPSRTGRRGSAIIASAWPHPPIPVPLAIRPEDILLEPGAALSAEVTDTVYLGNAVQIMARMEDGTRIALRQPATIDLPESGQRIGLRLPAEAVQILEAE